MAKQDEKLHALAIKRFERIENKERDQRKAAVEDIKFAQTEDGQWDDGAKEKRKNRPRFTINRVAGAVDQLIGDQRQNRTNIKIRPVSGGATEDVAKTLTGLIRNIESNSKANNAYDSAFDEAVTGGFCPKPPASPTSMRIRFRSGSVCSTSATSSAKRTSI